MKVVNLRIIIGNADPLGDVNNEDVKKIFIVSTAEDIFNEDLRFEVKSAGTDILAKTQINKTLLEWVDYIFVMEEIY